MKENPPINVWEKCELREWLNSTFIENAFSSQQISRMTNESVADKVFVLSVEEVEKYFKTVADRQAYPTAYLAEKTRMDKNDFFQWYTRSPGLEEHNMSPDIWIVSVDTNGEFHDSQPDMRIGFGVQGVRPAIWLSLK